MKLYRDLEFVDGRTCRLYWPIFYNDNPRFGPAALLIAGMAVTAGSQIYQGQVAAQEGKNEQAMSEYNARVMERDAQSREEKTAYDQRRQAEKAARVQSSMEAELGASGVVPTSGTPLLVQAKQASELELENLMIGYEGMTEAQRLRSAAAGYRMEGKLAKQRGKNRRTGSYLSAGSTLLSGFGNMDWGSGGGGGMGKTSPLGIGQVNERTGMGW